MAFGGILLIETSTAQGRVALARNDGSLAIRPLTNARELVSGIGKLLGDANLQVKDLSHIAVSTGPGSYTGLRVGIATAKTLAFAGGVRLHAIPTFDLLVGHLPVEGKRAAVLSDALKEQVYSQLFERNEAGEWQVIHPLEIRPLATLRDWFDADTTVIAEGKLVAKLAGATRVFPFESIPDEAVFGSMREHLLQGGYRVSSLANLEPLYLRGSSAEEKRLADAATDAKRA